ncbi:von Willebrand factor A domain-containing protein 3A [Brienomyrus brachyistius]|uniref:von Willebrand factor A domain-containing protein 3A n=1 Tax=Brienomyrus brachyistius TaxID=42636 RepID=UPI0020B45E25|nr:von Willebrand factor A domain-containing protein 3A [Brienomyrus brachyistius]
MAQDVHSDPQCTTSLLIQQGRRSLGRKWETASCSLDSRPLLTAVNHSDSQPISVKFDALSMSCLLPKLPNHNTPLNIKIPSFLPRTSADWLKINGLTAKGLDLYAVLSPNSYLFASQSGPIQSKTVTSTVNEGAMVEFEWHDGSMRNVQVDLPFLQNYQEQVYEAVRRLEERVLWLNTGSRRVWGMVCEPRVLIVVDLCQMNFLILANIQQCLRLLLEEQLANKESFNIIAFGTDVQQWGDTMAPPTAENLQEAWLWVQCLQCSGSRNLLQALRHAVEHTDQRGQLPTLGVYLLTSGVLDQDMTVVLDYVNERCSGEDLRLHVCLYSQGDEDLELSSSFDIMLPLRSLAHAGLGRFHWCNGAGVVESDDISALRREVETASCYLHKCSRLVDSMSQGATVRHSVQVRTQSAATLPTQGRKEECPNPLATDHTLTGLDAKTHKMVECSSARASVRPPNIAKVAVSPAQSLNSGRMSKARGKQTKPEVSLSLFYTEQGNKLGVVFKTYPKAKTVQRRVPALTLPKNEDVCSTKQWLKIFGVRPLKLDLHKLASGPDCTHNKKAVAQRGTSPQYCSVFPSVQINGVVKHLQLTSGELAQYLTQTEKLLRRYARRLLWLLSGSRCMFGSILEHDVCILLDTSGSMASCLDDVRKELESLIWDQLHQRGVRFTLLAFSDVVRAWRSTLVEASQEACQDAVRWLSQLSAYGGTCLLEALQVAIGLGDFLGCYLLSDGKPDSSCSLVLEEVASRIVGRRFTIHTVSLLCSDSTANDFLKRLAKRTGGRFHRYQGNSDIQATKTMLQESHSDQDLLALPAFEGDDLKKLAEEIDKVKQFRAQAEVFRRIVLAKQNRGMTEVQQSPEN